MDLGAPRHYVAGAMEFLLILSAVLSTVTGAFSAGRAPEPQTAATVVAIAAPSATQAIAVAPRAVRGPRRVRVARLEAPRATGLVAAIPLYADRLIE